MWKHTLLLRAWARANVPMIAYARPRVMHADAHSVRIVLPLRRRNRNHLGSMYFGALAVGADVAAGYLALQRVRTVGADVHFVFQDVHGDFLRRPTGDVQFACDMGTEVRALVDKALLTGEREALPVQVVATVPSQGDDPVARFVLTLSVKAK